METVKECKDFYGETMRLADTVETVGTTGCVRNFNGKIMKIEKKGDKCFVTVHNRECNLTLGHVESTKYALKERYVPKEKSNK